MMMRMLEAGGLPVVTDNVRQPDADNPNGYYEFERVKQVKRDPSWLVDAYGKAIKVVYRLLCELPVGHRYKVLMMNRHIAEIVASQDAMLQHSGNGSAMGVRSAELEKILQQDFARVQGWLLSQPNFKTLNVSYNSILHEPNRSVSELARFLGCGLNIEAMTAVVDVSLYRQKASSAPTSPPVRFGR
jgi:hypothetical protein